MNTIKLFVPYRFEKKSIDENIICKMFGSKAIYVSKGRWAITHILKSYGIINGKIGISAYMCPTVREALLSKGYEICYYDIDLGDLNPSIKSISKLIDAEKPKAIVIASMYGNPANLTEIEKKCNETNVIMIDDAAQCFGAKLDGKFVGSFGDGGFFSFSPGKPTAIHRGGYFCTKKKYTIKRTRHFFYALITYKDFYYSRYLAYENHMFKKKIWKLLFLVFSHLPIRIENDKPEHFERLVLGGVLTANLDKAIDYRNRWLNIFSEIKVLNCRMIKELRGDKCNPCKIVYVFDSIEKKERFTKYLISKNISFYTGYKVPEEANNCKNAKNIEEMLIELPIDPFEDKMMYLKDCVSNYFNKI